MKRTLATERSESDFVGYTMRTYGTRWPTQVLLLLSEFVPSGQVVLDHVTPVRVAVDKSLPWKLLFDIVALVKSVLVKFVLFVADMPSSVSPERFALVKLPPSICT